MICFCGEPLFQPVVAAVGFLFDVFVELVVCVVSIINLVVMNDHFIQHSFSRC